MGKDTCPKCGSDDVWRDEADVGVGVIYGPLHCNSCRYCEGDDDPLPEPRICDCVLGHNGCGMAVRECDC